jgi:hypothetical protein
MSKRATALQKRAASKRTADRRRPRKDRFPPLRERCPELFELPFVKPASGHSLDETLFLDDVDYWVPETCGEFLDEEFRGGQYALLTAQFMARHWEKSHSTLIRIFDAIAAKGGLWPHKRDPKSSSASVALGFVSTIGDLLKDAASNGTAQRYARAHGDHLAAHLAGRPPRATKAERASLERAIKAFRDFGLGPNAADSEKDSPTTDPA